MASGPPRWPQMASGPPRHSPASLKRGEGAEKHWVSFRSSDKASHGSRGPDTGPHDSWAECWPRRWWWGHKASSLRRGEVMPAPAGSRDRRERNFIYCFYFLNG